MPVHFHPPFPGYKPRFPPWDLQECSLIADSFRYPAIAGFETIGSIGELEGVAEASVWQHFEQLTAFVFEQNGFSVSVGTVATRNRQRRQYDVIARKNGRTVLAECKRWSKNRCRLPALRRAIGQHRERSQFYAAITREETVPVLVTLIEEEIRVFDGVPLVPIHRLNAFIGELDTFADGCSFAGYEEAELPDDLPEDLSDDLPAITRQGAEGE